MKQHRFKTLWGLALGFVLLAAAVPFASFAQTNASAKPGETITLKGVFDGRGSFIFEGNTIQYWHLMSKFPTRVTVNGKPWTDLKMPFKLDFAPEIGTAEIREKSEKGTIELTKNDSQLRVFVREDRESSVQISLAVNKKPAGPANGARKAADDAQKRVFLVLAGTLKEDAVFYLHGDRIEFCPERESEVGYSKRGDIESFPTNVTVNGKPWTNLLQDFDLSFVTDFQTAYVARSSENVRCNLRNEFDFENRYFDKSFDRITELIVKPVSASDNGRFSVTVSTVKTPEDYEARILRRTETMREKQWKDRLREQYRRNRNSMSAEEIRLAENLNRESSADVWNRNPNDSTDGKELPLNSGQPQALSIEDRPENQVSVTIDAVVDFNAGFRFQGNNVFFDAWPGKGRYPSKVRINGKPWTNLRMPFSLDYAVDLDSVSESTIDTEFYRYSISKARDSFSVRIENHGNREEPVRISLTMLKSKKPVGNNAMFPGGIPLPPEAMTSQEAFENFWKTAMSGNSRQRPSTAEQPASAGRSGTTSAQPGAAAPAQTKERSIVIDGEFDGRDTFVFVGNIIRYRHQSFKKPTDVTVNGKAWTDLSKPFELGFVPDFMSAKVAERTGRGHVNLSRFDNRFTLLIDDSASSTGHYNVKLTVNENADQNCELPEEKIIDLKTGFTGKGFFLFSGNTIRCLPSGGAGTRATVNGKAWTDLSKPFELDFVPDARSVEVADVEGIGIGLYKEGDIFYLKIDNTEKEPVSYQIKIAANPDEKAASGARKPEMQLPDGEVPITIEGFFDLGEGTFAMEENRVTLIRKNGGRPEALRINGKLWTILAGAGSSLRDAPFDLGFTPDYATARVVEMKGLRTFQFNIQDNRLELAVGQRNLGGNYFRVTIAVKKLETR